MGDDELIGIATAFREGILGERSSRMMCAAVCWPLESLLRMAHKIECESVETDLGECNHIWIKLADGRALDPTADQFNYIDPSKEYPAVYLGPPMELHGGAPIISDRASIIQYLETEATRLQRSRVQARAIRTMADAVKAEMDREES